MAATIKPQVTAAIRHGAELEKIVTVPKAPILTGLRNVASDFQNEYTPGAIAEIDGENLKVFDTSSPSQGVFFISQSDGSETRVSQIQNNGDRQLVILVPPSVSGPQQVQVRTQYTPTGTLRTGTFETFLSEG